MALAKRLAAKRSMEGKAHPKMKAVKMPSGSDDADVPIIHNSVNIESDKREENHIISVKAWKALLKKLTEQGQCDVSKLYNMHSLTVGASSIARRLPAGRWTMIGPLDGWQMNSKPSATDDTEWLDICIAPGGQDFDPLQFLFLVAALADLQPRHEELPQELQVDQWMSIKKLEGPDLERYMTRAAKLGEECNGAVVVPILQEDWEYFRKRTGSATMFVEALITPKMKQTNRAALRKALDMDKNLTKKSFQGFTQKEETEFAVLAAAFVEAVMEGLVKLLSKTRLKRNESVDHKVFNVQISYNKKEMYPEESTCIYTKR